MCRTQQASYRWLLGGLCSQLLRSGERGASLHVALKLPSLYCGGSMEELFQEEQPPLLSLCDTPPGVVFAQLIQVELPPQGTVGGLL